jgi:predicted nucleotide-binding protein
LDSEAHILLRVLSEKTRVGGDPVVVAELQEATGLSEDELRSAWQVLKNRGVIDAFPMVYAGRINLRGLAALAPTAALNDGAIDEIGSLTDGQLLVLDALATEYAGSPNGVSARHYLSKHEDHVSDIAEFVRLGFVYRVNDSFFVPLHILARLTRENSEIESLWYLAGHIYSCVRTVYKVRPGDPIKVGTLSVVAQLPAPKVQRGLLVLRQAPIWMDNTGDLSKITDIVTPSERVLGYKTLMDIVRSPSAMKAGASKSAGKTREGVPGRQGRTNTVFIVHGRDSGTKNAVARFVETLGFKCVILHERPSMGRTIITKFHEESDGAGFAIVLMTPDDLGKAAVDTDLRPRARQNVVFELGFFIGKLGSKKVIAMVKGAVERPSDLDGVLYISLDEADWQVKLGQELDAAGLHVDLNRLIAP